MFLKKTIVKVQHRTRELKLSWPLDEALTDEALDKLMFPREYRISSAKKMPDFNYIQKELLRNRVNKKLLWTEYLEECRLSGEEPLMYSQFCYHIQQDEQKRHATIHIKRKVDVRITDTTIEVFYNHNRIASHRRLYGRKGQYSAVTEHMTEDHQKYLEWNGDRFRKWAERIGINTSKVVDALLTSGKLEQQSYRSCMGLPKQDWLFSDTPKGASASAAVYSIVETAKANGLNVFTYLEYVLLYMPDTDWRNHPEYLEDLMPWSENVQAECKR